MKEYAKFFFELGAMRFVPRSGWHLIGIKDPESIAEHTTRSAQIAFILAVLEGHKEPEKVATMVLFHDMGETRVGDINKVGARYVEKKEKEAVSDQLSPLPEISDKIILMWEDVEGRVTEAGNIAKDADSLECALTAKEYMEQGYGKASDWFERSTSRLQTESAKKIAEELKTTSPNDWWDGLKVK